MTVKTTNLTAKELTQVTGGNIFSNISHAVGKAWYYYSYGAASRSHSAAKHGYPGGPIYP